VVPAVGYSGVSVALCDHGEVGCMGPTVQQVLFQLGLDPDDALLVDLTAPLARFSSWVRSWR
jgi:hypothetical protein